MSPQPAPASGESNDLLPLVEFVPEQRYTYFTLSDVQAELSTLLGRRSDLHVAKLLHPYLRDKVLGEAEALYDAA